MADNQKKLDVGTGTITIEYGEEQDGVVDTITVIDSDGIRGDMDLSFLQEEATHVIIGQKAFQNNTDITSVLLPDNTIEIRQSAFKQCSLLEKSPSTSM